MFGRHRAMPTSALSPDPMASIPNEQSACPEKPKKTVSQGLSSSFKRKFLSGLGKLKSLKGSSRSPSKRNGTNKGLHGLKDLDEDHELVDSMPVGLVSNNQTAHAGVTTLLKQCQMQSNGVLQFVGNVPMVSLDSLRRGLQSSSDAVVVLRVGEDPTDLDPAPNSIKHCSTELPRAVQQRITAQVVNASRPNSLGSSRQPSFSRALCKVRRQSAEGLAAVRNAMLSANANACSIVTGGGYSALPLRVARGALPMAAGQGPGQGPVVRTAAFSVPSTTGCTDTGPLEGKVLARGLTSSCSSKQWNPKCLEAGHRDQGVAAPVTVPSRRAAGGSGGDAAPVGFSATAAVVEGSSGASGVGWPQGNPNGGPQSPFSAPPLAPYGLSYPLGSLPGGSCQQQQQMPMRRQQHSTAPGGAVSASPLTSAAMSAATPTSPAHLAGPEPLAAPSPNGVRLTVQSVIASAMAGTNGASAACAGSSAGSSAAICERLAERSAALSTAAAATTAVPLAAQPIDDLRAAGASAPPPLAGALGSVWLAGGSAPVRSRSKDADVLPFGGLAGADDSIIGILESDEDEVALGPPSNHHHCSPSSNVPVRQRVSRPAGSPFSSSSAFGSRIVAGGGSTSANDTSDIPATIPLAGSLAVRCAGTGFQTPSGSGGPSSFGHTLAGSGMAACSRTGSSTGFLVAEPCVLTMSPLAPVSLPMGSIAEAARGSPPAKAPVLAPASAAAFAVITHTGTPVTPGRYAQRVGRALLTAAAQDADPPGLATGPAVAAAAAAAGPAALMSGFGSMAGAHEPGAALVAPPSQPAAAPGTSSCTGNGRCGIVSGATGPAGCGANGDEGDMSIGSSGGGETDLEPMFASTAVEQLMGSAEPDYLRLTLYMLLSNNPSLQFILEDIVRSAMAGRTVVHEQLMACPRMLQFGGSGPSESAAAEAMVTTTMGGATASGRVCGGAWTGTARCPQYGATTGTPMSPPLLAQQSRQQQQQQQLVSRNPLDDFLLLQVTACYVDHRATGPRADSCPQDRRQQPFMLPALFIAFTRPYATAVSAAAAATMLPPHGAAAAAAAVTADSLPPALHDTPLSPPTSRIHQQVGSPFGRTSLTHPKPGTDSGASGVTSGGGTSKLLKSPSLGSLLGSLGRPSWVRPSSALAVTGSPGASPKPHRGATGPQHLVYGGSSHGADPGDAIHQHGALPFSQQSASSIAVVAVHRQESLSSALGSGSAGAGGSSGALQTVMAECSTAPAVAEALEGLCARLRLEQTLLAQMPVAVTVLALDGRVLYQNGRSVAFLGNAVGIATAPGIDVTDPEHSLQKIFAYDTPALESMWDAVHSGKTWSGLVCMPPHLELGRGDGDATAAKLSENRAGLGGSPEHQAYGSGFLLSGGSMIFPEAADTDVVGQLLQQLRRPGSNGTDPRVSSLSLGYGQGVSVTAAGDRIVSSAAGGGGAGTCGASPGGFGWVCNTPAATGSPASPQDSAGGHERRSLLGLRSGGCGGWTADPLLAFTATAATAAIPVTAAAPAASGRAAVNLPRNISAPSFRCGAGNACPLPSVREAEACGSSGSNGDGAKTAAGASAGAGLCSTSNDLANIGRRISWNSFTPHCGPQSASLYGSSLYGSSPMTGGSPMGACAGLGGAAALPLAPSQQMPGSRRTRIHRSNSLAQTEVALDGSYRAMRLAASAASQGLLGPSPAGLPASVGGGGGGNWSSRGGEGLQSSGLRAADMPSPGVGGNSGRVPAAASPSGETAGRAALHVTECSSITLGLPGYSSVGAGGGGGCVGSAGVGLPPLSTSAGGGRTFPPSPVGPYPGMFAAGTRLVHGQDELMRTSSGGGAAAAAAVAASTSVATLACGLPCFSACCWHEIQANLVLDSVTLEWTLVLINHDVTAYVQAELEVRQVLDAEHRILEECFPRHVLEVMTSDKRRASAFGAATALAPGNGSPVRSASLASSHATSLRLLSNNGRGGSSLQAGALAAECDATDGRPYNPPSAVHGTATAAAPPLKCDIYTRSSAPALGSPGPAGMMPAAAPAAGLPIPGTGACAAAAAAAAAAAGAPVFDGPPAASLLHGAFQTLPALNGRGALSLYDGRASAVSQGSSAIAPAASNSSSLGAGCDRRSAGTHLCASSSIASFNPGSCMTNVTHGTYDSCDERTSYGFSQNLHVSSDVGVLGGDLAAAAATAPSPPLPRHLQLRSPGPNGTAQAVAYSLASNSLSVTSPSTPTCTGGVVTMSGSQQYMARAHNEVTVLFADIAAFTSMCGQVEPQQVMAFLNDLFTTFDQLVERHQVYKVETIGDCYMVCGGLVEEDAEGFRSVTENVDPFHAHKVFAFAADMLLAARGVLMPGTGQPVQLRVGIHSGPVMSGIVGRMMPRFCLFGDTVNVASRMESTGVPGAVHISSSTRALLGSIADGFMPTGGMPVKGKGYMYTYVYDPLGCAAKHLAARQPSQPVSRTVSDAQDQDCAASEHMETLAFAMGPYAIPAARSG